MAVVGRGVFCREEDQRHLSARRSGAVGCLLDMIALAMASTISNGSCSSQMPCRSPAAKQCCKWQVFKGLNRWHQQRYVRAIPVSKQYYRGVATKYCMHSIIYYYLRLYCKYVTLTSVDHQGVAINITPLCSVAYSGLYDCFRQCCRPACNPLAVHRVHC